MAIADYDSAYCEEVSNYIGSKFENQFKIDSFSKKEVLLNYISGLNNPIDILLVSPDFFEDEEFLSKAKVTIILSSAKDADNTYRCETVEKYQSGDSLVKDILNIYSDKIYKKIHIHNGEKRTKIVSVFSASGGSGKSMIAAALSILGAQKGKKAFYLDYQKINSTTSFFNTYSDKGFSDMFFYLKSENPNIPLKIQSLKSTDMDFGVDLFTSAESIEEMEGLTSEDIIGLTGEIAKTGTYDLIVLDLTNNFDEKNKKILDYSDSIVIVVEASQASVVKTKKLVDQLIISREKEEFDIFHKIFFAANKCSDGTKELISNIELNIKPLEAKIPLVPQMNNRIIFKENIMNSGAFREEINSLLEKIL